jgi:hypothetical protein
LTQRRKISTHYGSLEERACLMFLLVSLCYSQDYVFFWLGELRWTSSNVLRAPDSGEPASPQ